MPTPGFLEAYLAYCGDSEVPRDFDYWSGISLLAAAMCDRVWYEKMPGQRLVPNLYVVLVGPSGLGKGQAINKALALLRDTSLERQVYSGKTTGQYLADRLAGRSVGDVQAPGLQPDVKLFVPKKVRDLNGKLYLVTEELGLAVGSGGIADSFVKYMTGLYTGSPLPFSDGTRTLGEIKVSSYCINWLGGSTEEWLIRSISQDAIEGGFFGRTVIVGGKYNLDKRIVRPLRADDYEVREVELKAMLDVALHATGCFGISSLAVDVETKWYCERPAPEDERLLPGWKRQHDLVLKLAMVLAMSDYVAGVTPHLQIDSKHMIGAVRLAGASHQPLPKLMAISAAVTNKAMRPVTMVERFMQRHKQVGHRRLLQNMSGKNGFTADEVRQAVLMLQDQGKLEILAIGPRKAVHYAWRSRNLLPHAKPLNGADLESYTGDDTEAVEGLRGADDDYELDS